MSPFRPTDPSAESREDARKRMLRKLIRLKLENTPPYWYRVENIEDKGDPDKWIPLTPKISAIAEEKFKKESFKNSSGNNSPFKS